MDVVPKPALLFLCQLFGTFPMILQTTPNGRTKLVFSPLVSVWGISLGCILTICSIFAVVFDFYETSHGRPIKMLTSMNVITLLIDQTLLSTMAIVTVISSTLYCNNLINVYNTLRSLDIKLGKSSCQPNTFPLMLISFGSLTLAVSIFISITIFVAHFTTYYVYVPPLFLCYFSWANGNHFYHLCSQFCQRYKTLNEKITTCVAESNGEDSSISRIQDLMDTYWLLTESVQQSKHYYGSQLFVTVLSLYVHVATTLYNFFQYFLQPLEQSAIPYIALQTVWLVAHVSQLFLFVGPSSEITTMAKKHAATICKLINMELNIGIKFQMKRFLIQLLHQKVDFSGHGFFQVNCSIIPGIASSVVTYLVVLLQFRGKQSSPAMTSTPTY